MMSLILTVLSMTVASCHPASSAENDVDEDSVWVAGIVKSVLNPEFKSMEDFASYLSEERNADYDRVIMLSLHDKTVLTIANVVLKKYGHITPALIGQEYTEHENVYQSMNDINSQQPSPYTIEEIESNASEIADTTQKIATSLCNHKTKEE